MPPLATTIILAILGVTFLVRMLAEFNNELELPHIADASHGVCPVCGEQCLDMVPNMLSCCHCGCCFEVEHVD